MKILIITLFAECCLAFVSAAAFAQAPQNQMIAPNAAPAIAPNATEVLATEIGNLRKSLQTLNKRIGEIADKFAANANKQNQILLNLDVLTRAEQRAETLRRQLFETIEKETQLKTRAVQNEENLRPEAIERAVSNGSTRTPELRDARRRILEAERDNLRTLLAQVQSSRQRLESDVQQADQLVARLRSTIFPVIEREMQNLEQTKP